MLPDRQNLKLAADVRIRFEHVSGGRHPVVGDILYPVQRASDGVEVERYQRYLASPIGSVARDVATCKVVEAAIGRVRAGEVTSVNLDCDEVELVITCHGVQCHVHVSDGWVDHRDGLIGLDAWQQALEAWRRFLSLPKSAESFVEIEL